MRSLLVDIPVKIVLNEVEDYRSGAVHANSKRSSPTRASLDSAILSPTLA